MRVAPESLLQKLLRGWGWNLAALVPFSAAACPLLPLEAASYSPPHSALLPLRKSGLVRQLKLPLGADFASPLRIG